MRKPQPAARAATVTALLDLEQVDLLRHFKRPEEALTLSRQLVTRLSAVEGIDPHDLAHAYLRRATITWVNGRYQEAAAELQHAAALFREAGDPLQATFAEGNLGLVYMSMSRYAEAESFKLAALRAAEEINARKTVMTELGDLSVVYINLGRMERSFECSNRMVELAMEMGESAELSRGRGNRAYALLGLGRYEEAVQSFERANSLKLSNEQCYYYLGVSYHKTGQEEKAIQQYELLKKVNPRAAKTLWDVIHR